MSNRDVESKRGPKVGDAASLWNFTPSPGWSKDEAQILKLCLMKYGVGRWVQILDTGLLPGKLIQQLNGQTQRLIGQQSLAAYTGLQVDIDRIRADNAARTGVERKSGLIIWSGPNPNKTMRDAWRKEAQARFGLEKGELKDVDELLEEVTRKVHHIRPQSRSPTIPLVSLLAAAAASDTADLPREQKLALLKQLRKALKQMHAQLQRAEAGPSSQGAAPGQSVETPQTSAMALSEGDDAVLPVRMLVSRRSSSKLASSKSQVVTHQPSAQNTGKSSIPGTQKPPRAAKKRKSGAMADSATQTKRLASLAARNSAKETDDDQVAAEAGQAALDIDISQLQGMGFSKSKAKEALQENNHDLEAAIEWLVANCI